MSVPHLLYPGRAELAEGPVWSENALWWVDIAVGTLNRLDPRTGHNTARATGGFLGAACPCVDGRWLLAQQQGCALLDWETGAVSECASLAGDISSDLRFNDGKADRSGRFWVGTMHLHGESRAGGLYVLESSRGFTRVRGELTLSNGLAWSPEGDRFYHIDTPTRRVQSFACASRECELHDEKTLIQFLDTDGFPDGMTCDAEGNLWIALWGGSAVVCVSAKTGKVIERISLPVAQVSCCTFGGPDLTTLYITTAWEGFSMAQRMKEPLAGSIFAVETNTRGQPAQCFISK